MRSTRSTCTESCYSDSTIHPQNGLFCAVIRLCRSSSLPCTVPCVAARMYAWTLVTYTAGSGFCTCSALSLLCLPPISPPFLIPIPIFHHSIFDTEHLSPCPLVPCELSHVPSLWKLHESSTTNCISTHAVCCNHPPVR